MLCPTYPRCGNANLRIRAEHNYGPYNSDRIHHNFVIYIHL